MSSITNREDFKDYILRRLGHPVQQINVDDEQVEDRIDDAFEYWQTFSNSATDTTYFKYTITDEDVTNGYISLPDQIISVESVLSSGMDGTNPGQWMTPMYGITFDAAFALTSFSLIPYFITMNHLAELEFLFDATPSVAFNKYKGQLTLGNSLGSPGLTAGSQIVFKAQSVLDPNAYAAIWNDIWLKDYATALVKKQWATNLKLFSGVQLLGGVTVNGQAMYDEAESEIKDLQQQMDQKYFTPVLGILG